MGHRNLRSLDDYDKAAENGQRQISSNANQLSQRNFGKLGSVPLYQETHTEQRILHAIYDLPLERKKSRKESKTRIKISEFYK